MKFHRRGEVLNYLKKLKVKNWTYLIKDRNGFYELVQKTKPQGVVVSAQEEVFW